MSTVATERRPASGGQQQAQWASIDQVPERMRRMLEQTLGTFVTPALLTEAAAWTPFVDIEEEDDAYVIEAEIPGAKREDVNIELLGNELAITGEIKERERKGVVRRKTRRVGQFDYRVTLPNHVDPQKIEAKLHDGVLAVRIPKAEKAQRQKIEVKAD
jgi:HSP20 family protein